ncbi:MAG: GNAT family N-acetyltransferase [Gammaproteobacteria bacterium]|nr:GNAT family N-acetyltransferase [Gammaproteobacteria bacterium]
MEIAKTDEEIMACFDVMKQLRTQLKEDSWLATIRDMQSEGYVLAYIAKDDLVVAVAGYYICNKLSANGKSLYVYDLSTDERFRSMGFGKRLINDLKELARSRDCETIELDSGVQRFEAHKFYLREEFHIASHHFSCALK